MHAAIARIPSANGPGSSFRSHSRHAIAAIPRRCFRTVPARVDGERCTHMKLVVAIIKPHVVEQVNEVLGGLDVNGITLTEVRGHGQQRGHNEVYRGGEYKVDFLPKVKVEV